MAGHYPFSGKANRVSVFGFYEAHALSLELQEAYYKWWYDWTKDFLSRDADLRATKLVEFSDYPYGQHAHANFHLHNYQWATALVTLGKFIELVIFPKLDDAARKRLEESHARMLDELLKRREKAPRPESPDVGRYRHV